MEYRLLLTLVQNMGQLLTRNQLLEGIWDISGDFINDNTLSVYMKRLREKLEDDPTQPVIFKTIRGQGYMIEKSFQ
jgi:DNA-binding response OmpR family regulator